MCWVLIRCSFVEFSSFCEKICAFSKILIAEKRFHHSSRLLLSVFKNVLLIHFLPKVNEREKYFNIFISRGNIRHVCRKRLKKELTFQLHWKIHSVESTLVWIWVNKFFSWLNKVLADATKKFGQYVQSTKKSGCQKFSWFNQMGLSAHDSIISSLWHSRDFLFHLDASLKINAEQAWRL